MTARTVTLRGTMRRQMSAIASSEAAGQIGRLSRFQRPSQFLLAVGVTTCGDWLTLVAAGVVVFRLTGSAAAPALLILFRALPRLAGPTIGGALGDLLPLRRTMSVLLVAQACCTALVLEASHVRAVWAIFFFLGLSQVLGAALQPQLPAALARLVPKRQLGPASSELTLTRSTTMLVAPAVGVLLLNRFGSDWLFVADVVSFLIATLLINGLRLRSVHIPPAPRRSILRSAFAGLRPVLGEPVLRLLTAVWLANSTLVWALMSSLVVIASDRYGGDSRSGYLYAAVGVGGVLGAIFTLVVRPRRLTRQLVVASMLAELTPLLVLTRVTHLTLALVLLAVSSAAGVPYQAWGGAELNRRLPPHLLTRGNAVPIFALFLGSLLGSLGATILVPLVGWQTDLIVSGALSLAVVAAALLIPVRAAEPVPTAAGAA